VLGKFFKSKSVPNKDGNTDQDRPEKLHFVKVFELLLSNMEDTPVYALTHQLTIGSEIGNIVISDPSVSPRHATFVLQEEVVSVIDHGSVAGTYVNGKKIDPGKSIILEETDMIMVGDLEIRIKVGRVAAKVEEIPAVPNDEAVVAPVQEKPKIERKFSPKSSIDLPKKQPKKNVLALSAPVKSTNAVLRVLCVLADLILSYSILIVFIPFDEFRDFIEFIPAFIAENLDLDWNGLLSVLGEDLAFLKDISSDFMEAMSSLHLVPLIIVFFLNRFISTLLIGVSFSEFLLGVRPDGNKIWARIGGGIRVILGMLTWPFVIFDLSSIVSKRTLKEFLTFTNTYVPSKFISILGIIFVLPVFLSLALIAPVFQGFEIPEPVIVNDRIDQRVKVKVAQNEATEVEAEPVTDHSSALQLELTYNSAETLIIPDFQFRSGKSKLNVKNRLIFYQRDQQRFVEVEVYKNFNLKQLLGLGMKGNFFLYEKYPEIYNYVYEPSEVNIAFRKGQDQKAETRFANEVITFTKSAFSLDLDNVLDFMQTESPLIKGYYDFRAAFLELVEYRNFDQISFMKLGNILFMKMSFVQQKPFDLIIPLKKGQGRIFKIHYDKKENIGSVSSKFYKFNLDKANWLPEKKKASGEVFTAFDVFDLFSEENYKTLFQSSSKAQALYAYYYETSATVLRKGDPIELELWKSKVLNALHLLERLPGAQTAEGEENTKEKLLQNFKDTVDALENSNKEYFGISETTTI
jgi:FHA domain